MSATRAGPPADPRRDHRGTHRTRPPVTGTRDADGMAVASFVLGLVGLLVMNIVLGPVAVVLAGLALWRGTARRGRALLGLALGVADLVVLAALVVGNGVVVWSPVG
ncbi:DUF4190 domain-containing protein [Streptomyces sp. NPDC087659]|uniref:DUF4190 domain-containing protein n=1 Tax=Streptomyces sp. NPDC087659 TaxID=3365801 RepID=UPI00381BD0C3